MMHETLERRELLAGDMAASWQNAANPLDVNNDQVVSPLDALAFATEWGRTGPGPLDAPSADADLPMMYVDVDGDGALTEQDFDALVTYLDNQKMQPSDDTGYVMGEGEGSSSGSGSGSGSNSPPEAYGDDCAIVLHDQTLSSYVYGFDPDPEDTITYSLVSGPSNGSLSGGINSSDGSYEYTPNLNFVGTDSFEFQVSDGMATDTATITIGVYNTEPEAHGDDNLGDEYYSVSVLHDQPLSYYVYGTDPDYEDTITYSLVSGSGPSNGTLSPIDENNGSYTYTPNPNFEGVDSFVFAVTDGLATDTATVTIDVYNTKPQASGDDNLGDEYYSESVLQHQTLSSYVSGDDPDGDTITYALFSGPANGTLSVIDPDDGSYEYTPNLGFEGVDSFQFEVSDGIATDTATITIDVCVPQVTLDLRVAEDDSDLEFQFDHYVGTDTSFDTFWVLPVPFELEVTLPDALSPSDVQVLLWDGSILGLTSNEETLEFTALPPATGSILDAWAALAWTADPTLQIASDEQPVTIDATLMKHTEMVKAYATFCAELGIATDVKESILESMDDPFAQVKDYINDEVDFSALTPTQQTELTNFRDVELNALRVDMSQKLTDLAFDHLVQQATAKTDELSKMKEFLEDLKSLDISLADDQSLEITPVVDFDFNDTLKDALLAGNVAVVRDVLKKPHKLFSELGATAELYMDTCSSVRGSVSVKNLDEDATKSAYKVTIEVLNLPDSASALWSGTFSQEYTPDTGTYSRQFQVKKQY